MSTVDGRVALITGASKGLGRAMALALGQAGARLALVSRNVEQLNQTAAEADWLIGDGIIDGGRALISLEQPGTAC